jgi:serine/threonine protein kinase
MGGVCGHCFEPQDETKPLVSSPTSPKYDRKRTSGRKSIDVQPKSQSPQEDKVSVDEFQRLTLLGEGNFGKVYQVLKLDDKRIYAMKVLSKQKLKESNQLEHTITERNVLQHIDHPFLCSLRFAFQTQDKLFMVLDFVNGGELFFHLRREKKFSEARTKFYAAEIFLALDHLHVSKFILFTLFRNVI